MTEPRKPARARRFSDDRRHRYEAEERWREAYGPELAEKLQFDRRYAIIRIGDAEFAFSDYDRYLAALRTAWDAGLVPDHGPSSIPGSELPDVAPRLRDVDVDITSHGPLERDTRD
jgi:hypothetical protein